MKTKVITDDRHIPSAALAKKKSPWALYSNLKCCFILDKSSLSSLLIYYKK